jgi:hypothetical protein
VGSQVKVSEVKCSLKWSWLLNSSIVVLLTLSTEVTPLRINGRMTGCKGLLGSVKVNACVWSVGSVAKKFGQVVNNHVIHTTLHWAKKVMVKVWEVDGLIDNQVEHPPGLWIIVGYNTTHGLVSLTSEGLIIAHNGDRSIIV